MDGGCAVDGWVSEDSVLETVTHDLVAKMENFVSDATSIEKGSVRLGEKTMSVATVDGCVSERSEL